MKIPESLHFARPGWWAAHVLFVVVFIGAGTAFGMHLVLGHGVGGHHHGGGADHADHAGANDHADPGAGHDHADPASLRPLMREMLVALVAAQSAVDRGDAHAAQPQLQALATACDDRDDHGHEPDPTTVGPRFAELDHQLHSGAADLARVAATGDMDATRRGFADVVRACVSCHEQAPAARNVDLGRVARDYVTAMH